MTFRVKVRGLKRVQKRLREMEREHPRAFRAAMFADAVDLGRKIYPVIPIKTGRLRDSLGVETVKKSRGVSVCTVGVGAPYGVYVHEITDYYHKPPTQAKFIEEPYLKHRNRMLRRVGVLMRQFIKRKIGVRKVPSPFPRKIKDPGEYK